MGRCRPPARRAAGVTRSLRVVPSGPDVFRDTTVSVTEPRHRTRPSPRGPPGTASLPPVSLNFLAPAGSVSRRLRRHPPPSQPRRRTGRGAVFPREAASPTRFPVFPTVVPTRILRLPRPRPHSTRYKIIRSHFLKCTFIKN